MGVMRNILIGVLRSAISEALPGLDRHAEMGIVCEQLFEASVLHDGVVVSIYRGQIRIGSTQDHHEDAPIRVGTQGEVPDALEVYRAAQRLSDI